MLRLRPHLGSSRFPDSGNVRVNILVAKRGTYGLNTFSQARPYAHQSLCLHEREKPSRLVVHVCMFAGGDDVFYGYPGQDIVMNITATVLLAFGMSMDAFAASIGKGATLHKPKFSEALRTGLIFGAVETLTPLIGWGMGMLASRFVLEWNHWIAFVLLIFLGGRMIIEGFRGADDEDEEPRRRHGFWLLVTTAIATSLDAMAVGVGLAFLQVNIIATALAIGCATLIMSTLGMMVGRFYRLNYWEKSGNSRRAGADRHRRPDPLDALPRLIRTLPEVNIKVRLAVEHFFCCQCLPDFWLRTPGKRRHLQ